MTKATRRQSQEGLQYRRISRSRWAGVLLVALVWDGLAAHLGKLLRAWLGRQRSWLVVEPRRATPEFNPVEPLWASLKGTGLTNLVGDTLEEIIAAAERGIQRIRATPNLPISFPRRCGLSPW
jgi:transposase